VERVDVRKKSGGTLFLDVAYKGSTRDLSASLDDKKIGDLAIDIEEMTKSKLVITVAKAKVE